MFAHNDTEPPGQSDASSTDTRGGGVTVIGMLHMAAFLPAVTVVCNVNPSLPPLACPTFTCTEEPVLLPTNVAPELLAPNDHRKVALVSAVDSPNVWTVPAQASAGPATLQPITASVESERSWLPIEVLSTISTRA